MKKTKDNENLKVGLGNTLKQFRLSYLFTQEKVADFLEIEQSTYSAMENDSSDWPVSRIFKLAELYNVEPAYFLGYNKNVPIQPQSGVNYQSGTNNKYTYQPDEKIFELYERIIQLEKENVELKKK